MKKLLLLILLLTIVVRTAFAEDSAVLTCVVVAADVERICHELHIAHRVISNQALNEYGIM